MNNYVLRLDTTLARVLYGGADVHVHPTTYPCGATYTPSLITLYGEKMQVFRIHVQASWIIASYPECDNYIDIHYMYLTLLHNNIQLFL